jgi:hypothetical protein
LQVEAIDPAQITQADLVERGKALVSRIAEVEKAAQ